MAFWYCKSTYSLAGVTPSRSTFIKTNFICTKSLQNKNQERTSVVNNILSSVFVFQFTHTEATTVSMTHYSSSGLTPHSHLVLCRCPRLGSRRNARRIIRVGHVLCPPWQIRAHNSSRTQPVPALSRLLWNKMNTITEHNFYHLLLSSVFMNTRFRADKENTFNISVAQRSDQSF